MPSTSHNTTAARRTRCARCAVCTAAFHASTPPQSCSPIVAHVHEDFSYLHLPMNLVAEVPGYVPYAEVLRRIGYRLFCLCLQTRCDPPATTSECRTSETRAGAQYPLYGSTHVLTILVRCASYMTVLTPDGWVTPTVVAPQQIPVVQRSGQGRDVPPHTLVAVGRGVRKYTKATPSPLSPALQPTEGGKDLALHYAIATAGQNDAQTARSTGPSLRIG